MFRNPVQYLCSETQFGNGVKKFTFSGINYAFCPHQNCEFVMKFSRPGWPARVMSKRAPGRRTASDVADEILEFLENSRLRDVEEVADAVDLPEDKVEKILNFLTRTGSIRKGVQITHLGSNFIRLPVEKWGRRL